MADTLTVAIGEPRNSQNSENAKIKESKRDSNEIHNHPNTHPNPKPASDRQEEASPQIHNYSYPKQTNPVLYNNNIQTGSAALRILLKTLVFSLRQKTTGLYQVLKLNNVENHLKVYFIIIVYS